METLADRIARDGPLNELDAVGWIIRLTKKLEALHTRGQAHGGISPAALKTAAVTRTSLGMLLARANAPSRAEFHSPERILQGNATLADDTWATAAMLYTLLTGASPFAASDADTVRQKILAAAPSPLSVFDVADDDLQHILDAALARDATRRASTMTALRQALESWHPDPTVKDLPPVADDQPEDDEDDDERTVMRTVPAMAAVRSAMAKRELGPSPPMRAPAQTVSNMPATTVLAAATVPGAPLPRVHDLLEDDDENAKTSLMRVPMAPMRKQAPSVTNVAPAPTAPGATRPNAAQPATGFGGLGRAPGGPAARSATRPAVGARPAPPVAPEPSAPSSRASKPQPAAGFISREAVFDDGDDDEATVMREAPIELLMQTTTRDAGGDADRATPVNPISAEVAAAAGGPVISDEATPPAMPAQFENEATTIAHDRLPEPAPEVRAPEPTMLLSEESSSTSLPVNIADMAHPHPAPQIDELPDLFGGVSEDRPPTPAEQAVRAAVVMPQQALAPSPFASARESAPSPRATPLPGPQAALQAPAPPPSAAKGLLLGVFIALLLLAAGVGVYITLLKK